MKILALLPLVFLTSCTFGPPSLPKLVPDLQSQTVELTDKGQMFCSGVFIGEDVILTAAHCVVSEDEETGEKTVQKEMKYNIYSEVDDSKELRAAEARSGEVVKINQLLDLALIRVSQKKIADHHIASLAEAVPMVGETVILMGHPGGLSYSARNGIIAAYRKNMHMEDLGMVDGPWIQIAGSIYHGDSGSGVYNQNGELIGIVSFIGRAPGEGFCSHLDTLRKFLSE